MSKKCIKCKLEKDLNQFPRHKQMADGHINKCKDCIKADRLQLGLVVQQQIDIFRQRYSFSRIFSHRYRQMVYRVTGKATRPYKVFGKEVCTKEEFLSWCYKQNVFIIFLTIYINWARSDFNRSLAPSIDRIDNGKGYTIDNLQWLTVSENSQKYIDKVK